MLSGIQTWAASKVFELVATGVVIAALGGWLLVNNYKQRRIGEERVLARSEKFGDAANAKSENFRARSERPGAAERLRKSVCRDCGRQ